MSAERRPAGPGSLDEAEPPLELLTVVAGGERFAVELAYAVEVARGRAVVPLPASPAVVLGLTALRGRAVPVLDLPLLLGRARAGGAAGELLLFVGREAPELAFAARAVEDLGAVARAQLLAAPEGAGPWVRGALASGVLVLDAGALLGDEGLRLSPAQAGEDA